MKDDKDFFEELIDDETEAFAPELADDEDEFDDLEDDDEEGESSRLRTAVLYKNELLALLTLKTNERGGQIVRIDPRESLPTARRYETAEEAAEWFRHSLATSRKNGWEVVYDGQPLFG